MSAIEDYDSTTANRFEKYLSPETSPHVREQAAEACKAIAFYDHLISLGHQQDRVPNLVAGHTKISIPAYFRLPEHKGNPINQAALELVPTISTKPGYGNSDDVSVRWHSIVRTLSSMDRLEAARSGWGDKYIVAYVLGLLTPTTVDAFSYQVDKGHLDRISPFYSDLQSLVSNIGFDLNQTVVGEVPEIAALVVEKGYKDFLDYLVDIRTILGRRVDLVFESGPLP